MLVFEWFRASKGGEWGEWVESVWSRGAASTSKASSFSIFLALLVYYIGLWSTDYRTALHYTSSTSLPVQYEGETGSYGYYAFRQYRILAHYNASWDEDDWRTFLRNPDILKSAIVSLWFLHRSSGHLITHAGLFSPFKTARFYLSLKRVLPQYYSTASIIARIGSRGTIVDRPCRSRSNRHLALL